MLLKWHKSFMSICKLQIRNEIVRRRKHTLYSYEREIIEGNTLFYNFRE